MQTISVPSFDHVSRLGCFGTFVGVGGVEVTVVHRYDLDVDADTATSILATSDGGHVDVTGMHLGEECGVRVYFEIWRRDGSGMHGWADAQSRRIVQVG